VKKYIVKVFYERKEEEYFMKEILRFYNEPIN